MSYWEGITIVVVIATVQLILIVIITGVIVVVVIVIAVVYVVAIHARTGMIGNIHQWFLIVDSNISHIHSRGRRRRRGKRTRNRVVFRDIDCTFDIIRKVIGLLFYVDMESVG